MTAVSHHAPDDLLFAFACGNLRPPEALLLSTHMDLDPVARRRVGLFEAVGGVLLEEAEEAPLDPGALERCLDRLGGQPQADPAPAEPGPAATDGYRLPPALRRALGPDVGALPWRRVMRGVEELPLSKDGDARARLLRIAPGVAVLRHSHRGAELTLVLEGAYRDGDQRFGRGDLQYADGSVDHRPVAEAGPPCLCFVVTEAPIRFTGPVGRFLNPFVRF